MSNIPEYYPGIYSQPLFDYMQDQFGLILLETEMSEIIEIVKKMINANS